MVNDRGCNGSHGMNWIRKERRLAIYLRDGMACCWCGLTIEDGIRLTLDHAIPRSRGGSNESTNLFTACIGCNGQRKHYSIAVFARQMQTRFAGNVSAFDLIQHIQHTMKRQIDVAGAQIVMRRRGGYARAMKAFERGLSPNAA